MDTPFSTGVNRLPHELSDLICDFAANHGSSKSLRLTARRFYSCATRNVFKTLLIYQHPEFFAKLNHIAHSPELAPLVETVCLPRQQCLTESKPFKQWLSDNDLSLNGGRPWIHFPLGEAKALEKARKRELGLRQAFASYEYWREGQEEMEAIYRNLCCLIEEGMPLPEIVALDRLPRLQHVECLERSDLIALNRRILGDKCRNLTRIELEAWEHNSAVKDGDSEFRPNRSLSIFLIENQCCGGKAFDLKSKMVGDIIHALYPLEFDQMPNTNFSCIRSLTIDTTPREEKCQLSVFYIEAIHLSEWFPALNALESLTLIQYSSNLNSNILGRFNQRTFPSLRRVHLQYVTTTAETLNQFVSRYQGKLESLRIERPILEPSQWNPLRGKIASYTRMKPGGQLVLTDSFEPQLSIEARAWHKSSPEEQFDTSSWWSGVGHRAPGAPGDMIYNI